MNIKSVFCLALLSAFSLGAAASGTKKPDRAAYHWVIETGKESQPFSIVRIYRNDNQLVYEKQFANVVLDVKERRTQRKLNKMLAAYKTWKEHVSTLNGEGGEYPSDTLPAKHTDEK